jgi:sucrose-6-phosphate hydrolase SacC (GH32 family)
MTNSNGADEKEGMPFSGQFSFPSKLDLRTTKDGLKLYRWPIKEIESLYSKKYQFKNLSIEKATEKLASIKAELLDLSIEFESKDFLKLMVRGLNITYNRSNESFEYKNCNIPAAMMDGKVKLRVLLDRSSLELFVNDGANVATFFAVPKADDLGVTVSGGVDTKINSLIIHELKWVWK